MRDFYLRWWRGSEPIMGIDLRDDVVLFAQSTTLAVAEEPPKTFAISLPRGVIEKGVIKDIVRLASILKESQYISRLSGCRCAVALPSNASFTACLDIPDDVVFANQSEAYAWALAHLSLDASKVSGKVYLDNRRSPKSGQLLFVAARLSAKEILEETFQALGLELSCITLRSIALHKGAAVASRCLKKRVTLWIDLTDWSPSLHLFEGEVLRFSRCFHDGLSGGIAPFALEVWGQLRTLDVSRYAEGEITTLCAGPEALVHDLKSAWKDKVGSTFHAPLSRVDIEDIQTEEAYQDRRVIATGLVLLLRESL